MSIKLLKVGNSFNVPQKQYICDTEQERDDLKAYFGDLALVIETGLTYILNSEGTWMDYPLGGGGENIDTTMIAEDFSIEKSYDQNDLVIYDGTLYRATTAITPGEFTPNTWVETNLAAEIEARGGSSAVHPDWNENNEQSPNYIQNRTHYTGLLSNLVNPEWDGDVTSELAPELTRLTPMEQYRLQQAWFYKLTDSLETDLTLDDIQLACKGNADLGQGDPITFSNFGSFKDFLYMIAQNFYQLFEVESPQLAYEFLLSLITESKLEDNQTYPFSNATSDQLVTISRMCGEMFGAYFLVKVKQDGEYTVSNESGTNVITLNLTRGWYAIGTQLYGNGLTIETYPVKYEFIVPLDSKYTPPIINTKFADMSAQVDKIAPLKIELRSTEIPDFEAGHYYYEGDLIYHNFGYYSKKVSGQSGEEFNSDDWDTPADQGLIGAGKYYLYAIPYIKGYTSKKAYYNDFEQAYREGRSVQFFLDGLFSYEFLCSAKAYDSYNKQGQTINYVEYKMDMVSGGTTLIFHVESTYQDISGAPNIEYTPYVDSQAYNVSPYTIYPTTRAEMAVSMYDDDRLLAIRKDLLTSSPKSLIIAQSGESASGDPWAITLEKDRIVQYTFHSDSDATKTTLLDFGSSATIGQILKKNQYGYFGPGDIIYYGSAAPTDTQQIWIYNNIVKIYNGTAWVEIGGGGTIEALPAEEMLELFAEKELISSPGLGYYEFTADPNGDYVYDNELHEYRLAREGETGEYSATISLVGCEENNTTYILVY